MWFIRDERTTGRVLQHHVAYETNTHHKSIISSCVHQREGYLCTAEPLTWNRGHLQWNLVNTNTVEVKYLKQLATDKAFSDGPPEFI